MRGAGHERKTLSLAELTALAVDIERIGRERGKAGAVIIKHSAGSGWVTPYVVAMTGSVRRAVSARGTGDDTRRDDMPCSDSDDRPASGRASDR